MTFAEKIRQNKKLLKLEQNWLNFYTEVYKNSYPQAEFQDLVKNATIINGVYDIGFKNYVIGEKTLKTLENKYKPKYYNRINSCIPKIIYYES